MYCEGTVSFRYKWDGLESYIKYVLEEDPRSGKVFIFMHRDRRHLRVFYYERNGYVLSEKYLDRAYRFVCGLRYLRYHERRTIKQTYYSGESQIEVGQLPTEKTDGGKGQYA